MFKFVSYIIALIKGLAVTFKHIFKKPVTDRYPKKKREMLPRYRGLHYLARYDDGKERCVYCQSPMHILFSRIVLYIARQTAGSETYKKIPV